MMSLLRLVNGKTLSHLLFIYAVGLVLDIWKAYSVGHVLCIFKLGLIFWDYIKSIYNSLLRISKHSRWTAILAMPIVINPTFLNRNLSPSSFISTFLNRNLSPSSLISMTLQGMICGSLDMVQQNRFL